MCLPVARYWHDRGRRVEFVTLAGYADFVAGTGHVDEVYSVPKKARWPRGQTMPAERLERYGIDCTGAEIVSLWCPAWRHESATGGRPWMNRIEAFWTGAGLPLAALPSAPLERSLLPVPVCALPPALERRCYILIQAHSNDPARDVPADLYQHEIDRAHDAGLLVVATGTDEKKTARIPADVHDTRRSIDSLCRLVYDASLVMGPDSACVHLAAVWDIPTIVFCGPTNGRLLCRHYPFAYPVQGKGCKPCFYQGKGWDCIQKHRREGSPCDAIQALSGVSSPVALRPD